MALCKRLGKAPGFRAGLVMAEVVNKWLNGTVGAPVTVGYVQQTRDLQHGRVLRLDWAAGAKTEIILDQGMGYWRSEQDGRAHTHFDFGQSTSNQINRLSKDATHLPLARPRRIRGRTVHNSPYRPIYDRGHQGRLRNCDRSLAHRIPKNLRLLGKIFRKSEGMPCQQ